MALSNIQKFDEIAGQAFGLLYESFPLPRPLLLATVIGSDEVLDPNGFTGAELLPEAEFALAALIWLRDAGFIKGELSYTHGLLDAILTLKGLEALKAVPDSLQAPLGERLMEAAKSDSRDVLRSLVGQVLGMGIQLITP